MAAIELVTWVDPDVAKLLQLEDVVDQLLRLDSECRNRYIGNRAQKGFVELVGNELAEHISQLVVEGLEARTRTFSG